MNHDVDTTDPAAQALGPRLRIWPATGSTRAVVLVLHGGRERSLEPTTVRQVAYRRMVPIARSIGREVRASGAAVWLLRNRLRGWNEPKRDALVDAQQALSAAGERHPDARIVLVGHSMGGRAALLAAGTPGVVAVCALAPWLQPDDPVDHLAHRAVLIAHGDEDTWTDPARSEDYARRARAINPTVCRFVLHGTGHAMLRRRRDWTGLTRAFVADAIGARPPHPLLAAALHDPSPERIELPKTAW